MSVIDTLIFNRTQSDIANDTDKSYISYEDLNRVEQAITYLKQVLNELGYNFLIEEKQWIISDFRTNKDMQRLYNNIQNLRNEYPYLKNLDTPNPIKYESIQEANDIERILYEINRIIKTMQNNYVYCGVANMGQTRLWQQRFRRLPKQYTEWSVFTSTYDTWNDLVINYDMWEEMKKR